MKGKVDKILLQKMKKGVELRDGFITPDELRILNKGEKFTVMKIVIHEGRKRVLRRFFKVLNKEVVRLKRVKIGNLEIGDLKEGHYREITKGELKRFKKLLREIKVSSL